MFFVDDLGYGDLGFTGHPTTHTPALDRLASTGKRLTQWYSGYPVCTSSRTAASSMPSSAYSRHSSSPTLS